MTQTTATCISTPVTYLHDQNCRVRLQHHEQPQPRIQLVFLLSAEKNFLICAVRFCTVIQTGMMIASGNSSTSSAGTASTSFSWWSVKTIFLVFCNVLVRFQDVGKQGQHNLL